MAPVRDAEKDPGFDQRCEAHGDSAQEKGVRPVGEHHVKDVWVGCIAEERDGEGGGEEDDIETEEEDRCPVEPAGVVRDSDEEERDDACAHGD